MLYLAGCRDYKNKYVWVCPCGRKTQILFHRTQQEFLNGGSPVKQICSEHHVSIPLKYCNKCHVKCDVSDVLCVNCEPAVIIAARKKMEEENGHKTS